MEFHELTLPTRCLVHLRDLPDRKAGKIIKAFLDYLQIEKFDETLDDETFAFVRLMSIAMAEIQYNERMC